MKTVKFSQDTLLFAFQKENGSIYAVPPLKQPKKFRGSDILWAIASDESRTVRIRTNGKYCVQKTKNAVTVFFDDPFDTEAFNGIPCRDFLGNSFSFCVDNDSKFQNAVAKFYWKSLMPACAERTFMRKRKKWRDGYVLSTLALSKYAGTYPAVDHEFHIRGRMAMGDRFDLGLVKRMMLLQIKTMQTDRSGKNRIPCSVQPSGKREYHITRKSIDKTVKARMFPITGILELCEEMYQYYCLTKDMGFIQDNISALEAGLQYAEGFIDTNGKLFADVYYEDQVMKNGANAQAQAFAVHSFHCAAKLESMVGNDEKADRYHAIAEQLKKNYSKPIPYGYWDSDNERYVDWIDTDGNVHDHIHLLANALSVTYGFNDPVRNEKIHALLSANDHIFQKFPSFVSAKIEAYSHSEIGDGGPYDLCAAGRYWCHDAKYRRSIHDAKILKDQLDKVYDQAVLDHFEMGERYDMNYVYYNTGDDAKRNWHGSPLYYEYPNVFIDVLVHDFFGILTDEEADLRIAPCCTDNSKILMESFGIYYAFSQNHFTLTNISRKNLHLKIDLSKITADFEPEVIMLKPNESYIYTGE